MFKLMNKYILSVFLIIISGQLLAKNELQLDKGGINIDGLVTIKFPTEQEIASTYNDECNLQTIDSIGFPVMCQQLGSTVFFQGRDKITNLGLFTLITSGLDPFGLFGEKNDLKKRIAIGTGLMIAGASIVATCPPISVNQGFHNLSFLEKLQQAQAFGYIPDAPPNFDLDVDDVVDPNSCSATMNVSIDNSNNNITNFGDFNAREFAYTSPFGSYPSAAFDLAHIPAALASCTASLASLVDISVGPNLSVNFIDAPQIPDVDLSSLLSGLFDLIIDNIGMTDFEIIALNQFNDWKSRYRQQNPAYCTDNTCQFEHGFNRMTFYENVPSNVWGNVTPKLEYYQDINVMEYFDPEITALPLVVNLEALETGGVTVNAYPPRSFTGTPPADRNYTFDQSWLGIVDNCEANPTVDFNVANFYPLGNWDIPITVTDRVGNVTTSSMRIVVEDTIPPDLLPLEAVGIPVADGTTVINFIDPGIGCVDYLCEGFPSTKYLHPPAYFDFASIAPDVECFVDNVLNANLIPCTVAQFPVNDVSLVTWSIADPSGNITEITQEVFVRENSFNQVPTVVDVNVTIGQNSLVQIPLSGNDADYDPLNFNVFQQPNNGNLDAQIEPLFQTRFISTGMIQSASGMIMVSLQNTGEQGSLLSVPDEKRLYLYQGDLFSNGGEVVNRYELSTITPSAISMSNSKIINSSQDSLYQVLRPTATESGVWIADWQARKVFRYTYNDLSDTAVEKEIFALPALLEQPSGLVVEQNNNAYKVLIADRQDNELWKFEISRTGTGSLNNQTYTVNSSLVIATLPFAVDVMDKWNSNNNTSDTGEVLIASWSAKQLVWFDWDNNGVSETWDISALVDDLDGPNNPGLPILQDPRDIVLVDDSTTQMTIRLFDQAELKYVEKIFIKSNHTVICSGGTLGNPPIYCTDPERDVLRFPALVDILSIEEHNGLIYVLDKNTTGYQHLYRFDLSGRLDAVINLYENAPSPNPLPPVSQTVYVDMALMDNGDVLLLEKGDSNNIPSIEQLTVNTGVDEYIQNSFTVNTQNGSSTVALDVNASDIIVLSEGGLTRILLSDIFNQTLLVASTAYNDLTLSNTGEIYLSNSTINTIDKYSIGGVFSSSIGSNDLDFNNDTGYGKLFFDNTLDKLWVSDFANIFYPDLGTGGETHRMPRMSAYAPNGSLLERLIPDGDPNDFFSFLEPGDFGTITSMAVGPDRFYVAESAPLKRLHVFDTSEFVPVTCTNLPIGEVCQEIGYTPNNGFIGTETFTYGASDPFNAASNTATVTITVIDDQQAPVLTCPASISLEMNNASGFVADLDTPEQEPNSIMRDFLLGILVSENTDLPVVEATHDIPVALPLGMTTVTYSATDGSNNTGNCQTIISVSDTIAPFITPVVDMTVEATALETPLVDIGLNNPITTDFSGFILTNDAPMTFPIGETIVTWTAIDNQGNQSQYQQSIVLQDTTAPEYTVAATYPDIVGSSVEAPINYTLPQATDVVGINDAGVVCLPAIGDLISMGPNLVQCNVADIFGNKASTSFTVNYYDSDSNFDGIVNVLDQGGSQFSDATNGGQTNGEISSFGNYVLKVYEAPLNEGVAIGLKTAFLTKGVLTPATMTACSNQISMNNLDQETILFDDISVSVFDHVIVTCLVDGYKVISLLGNNDFIFALPNNLTATSSIEFNNSLTIKGWLATAGDNNIKDIVVRVVNRNFLIAAGQTVDLSNFDFVFTNGFE